MTAATETGRRLPSHRPGCRELYEVTPDRDTCTCPRPRPDEVPTSARAAETVDRLAPLRQQIARIARRAAHDLSIADGDWPDVAAAIVVELPPLATGRAAVELLDEIRRQHAPVDVRAWEGADVARMCVCCHVRFPCPTARTLNGDPQQ